MSNLGRARQVIQDRRLKRGKRIQPIPLNCSIKTGEFGWLLDVGDFLKRSDLMRMFEDSVVEIDHSRDMELLAQRQIFLSRRKNQRKQSL